MASIDVEDVLSKLTNPQKISLLSGIDFWHTQAIPEHGIPSIRVTDGPNGVRGTRFFNGIPAACFPCGTGLGATWDSALLREAGAAMGEESKAKGAHVILGPTINIQRSPLGGRGFESLSEDPVLAGVGAASLVNGIQDTGIVACIKHFVCNDQEHERNAVDVIITDRAMREIYLLAFQIAVRDSKPGSFMTAYNKVNGTHVSENPKILKGILRGEWAWEGLTMSDWYGTYSTAEAVNAGLDLEMPGPSRLRGGLLQGALASNKVTEHAITQRAREVLNLVNRCAASGIPENAKEETRDTPETAALLKKISANSIVLLKNEGNVLPLKKNKSTLIVGPNAKIATYCGGGSASLLPYYAVTPYDGITALIEEGTEVKYTVGCYSHRELPLLGAQLTSEEGKPGMTFRAYNEPPSVADRKPIDEMTILRSNEFFIDYYKPAQALWYGTFAGTYVAERDGDFEFGLCVYGAGKLFVDDKLVVDNETTQKQGQAFFGSGTVEEKGTVKMEKGKTYNVRIEFASAPASKLISDAVVVSAGGGVRIGGAWVIDAEEEIKNATALAKEVDQVIICAGLNLDWESEGYDRADMDLPGHMPALITALSAANPNTVVVMQSGTPVTLSPFLDTLPALLHAWYGGNETGNAIASVVFGETNPSAKLPLSWPARLEDNPAYLNYRSERGRTLYGEDVYVGYRWYEAAKRDVAFAFGHGLSYTTFKFGELKVELAGEEVVVSLDVTNAGEVAGAEVVQVYVSQDSPSIRRPVKELKGFEKVFLAPGETKKVEVKVQTKYATSFWDEARDAWISEKGTYKIFASDSSQLVEGRYLEGNFEVAKTSWWNGI
ncbi:hypothetical protein V495_03419 [Pseudogymnoascus sp. VKM F-4514 (FW-929)]|nr:hypothetical protein V495_03419 [Pseudogymnoascus sp. VKM F-4514 (FW-929)]KFY61940.1 hypothetical protein V497_02695 [Pseudogymnoascus sp. VKM F-4516 (FW-969)]